MTSIGEYQRFVGRMRIGQVGRQLNMTGVNMNDQAAVVRSIQDDNGMQSWEQLYALVLDGTDLELFLVINPGAFFQDVTGGHEFPDLTVTFYALDAQEHEEAQAVLSDRKLNPV